MNKFFAAPVLAVSALALTACGGAATEAGTETASTDAAPITAEEVAAAQQAWGEGIVAIGKAFTDEGDYRAAAVEHIAKFYDYETEGSTILFKPTLAAADQFRGDKDEALSYFVGTEGTEDGGFAIAPYTAVRWENEGTVIDADSAMAMGNYYFTGTDGAETKVEYSFGYKRAADGTLKINLHHSSLPFSAS